MSKLTRGLSVLALAAVMCVPGYAGESAKSASAMDFGAKGDGVADDTAAIQKALDSVGSDGVVHLPAGSYRLSACLQMPERTTLIGDAVRWEGCATKLVIPDKGYAAVRLSHACSVKGLAIVYPNNENNANPDVYPPAILLDGINPSVEDIVFGNAWIGISTIPGGSNVGQGLFRNITGFVHHVGIHLSSCRDVNRIENVHWFVGGKDTPGVTSHFVKERVGFEFGDVDGTIMTGCFMIGGKTFFHQMKYKDTADGSKQGAHSLGFQISQCWIEDVDNGFIFEGATGFGLYSSNILVRKDGVGVSVITDSLFYNAVINGVQVRSFGAPIRGFEYGTGVAHPRNRLSIGDCQVVDGSPAILLKSGAVRANIHDNHLQSVPDQPAIRIDKGADMFVITNNVLTAGVPIEDNSGSKRKTVSGNLIEK